MLDSIGLECFPTFAIDYKRVLPCIRRKHPINQKVANRVGEP